MIRHLKHNEIDKQRWNACIDGSANPLPYAYSFWLDAVCPGWEALVQDDYAAVMPLTRNSRLGIDYLYQPYFTQQLGVFSKDSLNNTGVNDFLSAIPAHYRYIDIQLNSDNQPDDAGFIYTMRRNCTLSLSAEYSHLVSNYHRNCRRNIRKAVLAGNSVGPGPIPAVFTHFIQRNLVRQLTGLRKHFYPTLERIVQASIQNNTGEIVGMYGRGRDLLAAGWFVVTPGRCTFLVCASTVTGKKNNAMYMLVDHVIREKAGTGLIFDFAGSNNPGIEYFNLGFGAKASYYPALKRNLLPWPLRWIKR